MIGVVKNMLSGRGRKRKGVFAIKHGRVERYMRIITLD